MCSRYLTSDKKRRDKCSRDKGVHDNNNCQQAVPKFRSRLRIVIDTNEAKTEVYMPLQGRMQQGPSLPSSYWAALLEEAASKERCASHLGSFDYMAHFINKYFSIRTFIQHPDPSTSLRDIDVRRLRSTPLANLEKKEVIGNASQRIMCFCATNCPARSHPSHASFCLCMPVKSNTSQNGPKSCTIHFS